MDYLEVDSLVVVVVVVVVLVADKMVVYCNHDHRNVVVALMVGVVFHGLLLLQEPRLLDFYRLQYYPYY